MYKVLIVEDEVLVRVGLKTTIDWEAIGFQIISEASNGEQGYEHYQKYRPDVVITDIKMPKQDGLWLVEKIRKEDKETKILVLTCYDEFSFARKALKVGADDYILKSEVEDEELVHLMDSMKLKLDVQNREKEIKDRNLTDQENLKRSIFTDLIRKNFDMDEKRQRNLLDINFPVTDTAYAFIGLSMLHKPEQQADIDQINDAVMNIFYEQLNLYQIQYIGGQQNNSYLLFITSPGLNAVEMKRILTYVNNGARQYFDISVNIVYSKVFEQMELAGNIYRDYSIKAQILFYGFEEPGMIRQMDVIHFTEPNVFDLKKQYNINMIEAAGHENLTQAEEIIEELNQYFKQNVVSPRIVKIFYSNLMGDLFSNYGFFLTNREIFETHEVYHDKVIHSDYLQDIHKILTGFLTDLMNEIKSMRYNNSKFLINQALNYIENHYTEDISLEDVAKKMNLSKQYLCSVFKKETNENMSLYINKLRIEKAKQMLLESDIRIKEIFEKVGYSNQQYFSKMFKKITGMTILEYKEDMVKK